MKIKSPLLNWWKGSCILLGISAATWGFAASQLKELYVAPEIATAVSPDGSIARPYDSIHRAVTEVRGWREAGLTAPVAIYLRGGRHQLKETVVLGLQDGNPSTLKPVSMDKPGAGELVGPAYLTIAAYPGETPVVSAGVPVTGWKNQRRCRLKCRRAPRVRCGWPICRRGWGNSSRSMTSRAV